MLATSTLLSAVTVLAASEEQPHYHNGKLKPYKTALEMPGMKHRAKHNYEGGEELPLTLLRNGKRIQPDWPLTDSDRKKQKADSPSRPWS